MCAPTKTTTTTTSTTMTRDHVTDTTTTTSRIRDMTTQTGETHFKTVNATSTLSHNHHRGFLYGTLSLALVVMSGTVVMGHFQSQRDSLGCNAMCVGSMTSLRSMLTLVSSTLIGQFSDHSTSTASSSSSWLSWLLLFIERNGGARKWCLVLGILGLGLDLFLSCQATSIQSLWIAMIPSSLLQQNFNVLKALFGDYHNEKESSSSSTTTSSSSSSSADRAGSVGTLGMAAGLAFMMGPFLSSTLFTSYHQATIFGGVCLCLALVFVWLLPQPKNLKQEQTMDGENPNHDETRNVKSNNNNNGRQTTPAETKANQTRRIWHRMVMVVRLRLAKLIPACAQTPPAVFIMVIRLCMGLAFHIFQTIWTVALKERFQFGPKDYSQYFGFVGLTFALSQGLIAKYLLKQFVGNATTNTASLVNNTIDEKARRTRFVLLACALMLGGGRLFAYQTHSLPTVYALFFGIVTALGIINTILTADTSKIAPPQELGGLFGVLASVESLAGITGPMLGGALASKIHPVQGPLMAVVSLYGVVFAMVYWGYENIVVASAAGTDADKNNSKKLHYINKNV